MKKTVFISLIFFCTIGITFGQKNSNKIDSTCFHHSLGIGAGFTTGLGMSYRYSFNKLKLQLTFAPFKDNYSIRYNTGVTAIYSLIGTDYTNFFLYQGNTLFYEKVYSTNTSTYWSGDGVEKVNKTWNHGVGIGIEFIILKRIGFNIMGGYAGYDSFRRIGITGETGLYFMF